MNYNNYDLKIFDILTNKLTLILDNPYIVGMGYGLKTINGHVTSTPTLTFFVREKLPYHCIFPQYRIPKFMDGILTDVQIDGEQKLCAGTTRPAYAGLSVSNASGNTSSDININSKYGTITYPVTDVATKSKLFLLSTAHVLNCNVCAEKKSKAIMQPSPQFGGIPPSPGMKNFSYIGELDNSTPLKWKNTPKEIVDSDANYIDAAIAYVGDNYGQTRKEIFSPMLVIGSSKEPFIISKVSNVKLGDKVWFITANSPSIIYGTINSLAVARVLQLDKGYMLFSNQILVSNLSKKILPGDSGSLGVLSKGNTAFGMLISSDGDSNALFTPMQNILDYFKVTLASPTDDRPIKLN